MVGRNFELFRVAKVARMVDTDEGCARCHTVGVSLYENAAKPGEMLCFPCLSNDNPSQVNRYPGWREREQRHEQRAQVARQNFRLTT
jgi:hypothetical protein